MESNEETVFRIVANKYPELTKVEFYALVRDTVVKGTSQVSSSEEVATLILQRIERVGMPKDLDMSFLDNIAKGVSPSTAVLLTEYPVPILEAYYAQSSLKALDARRNGRLLDVAVLGGLVIAIIHELKDRGITVC